LGRVDGYSQGRAASIASTSRRLTSIISPNRSGGRRYDDFFKGKSAVLVAEELGN